MNNFLSGFLLSAESNAETIDTSIPANYPEGGIFKGTMAAGYGWINDIMNFLNASIIPICITLLITAALLIVFLSVLMVKAETSDEAKKFRKRIIGVGVAVFLVIILLFFIGFFLPNLPEYIRSIREAIHPTDTIY